jgi:ketosteroid isomerase-like protein
VPEPVEVVRQIYERWNSGESTRDLMHDDVEYVNPPDAVEPGTLRGRESFNRVRDIYPDFAIEPERYVEVGDEVVVVATVRGSTESGMQFNWRQGYIWTVRDGKAERMRWFNDPRTALAEAGVED